MKQSTFRRCFIPFPFFALILIAGGLDAAGSFAQSRNDPGAGYLCEENLIEVMFAPESRVRIRGGVLIDQATDALAGVDGALQMLVRVEWSRGCDLPEAELDEMQARGESNTGKPVYNLNNIYRLRIPSGSGSGSDIWALSRRLEALPGVLSARPVPKPARPPLPPDYVPVQNYLRPGSNYPAGIDGDYAWTMPGGSGSNVTVCDLEYSWNYNHADLTKGVNSQINQNVADPFSDTNHGTAVAGVLVSDNNGWGTTGICHGASLKTCGTYYGTPPAWNVAGAIAVAVSRLSPGDVILLEQQWDYTGSGGYVPIEWWCNYYPASQSFNAVYAAIQNAIANRIFVVEAGGNGSIDTDSMTWYGDSEAIIVGAGGAYPGGTYPESDRMRISFSSYGKRFDLQGWGEDVVTTGYGDLYSSQGANYWYTSVFAGTSSASAIVAGAVASTIGYWKANISTAVPYPRDLRTELNYTGTIQYFGPQGDIGPLPDLRAAFAKLCTGWSTANAGPESAAHFSARLAWGDYDGDGDPDLFISNDGRPNRLFRNDGGVFADVTSYPLNNGNGTGGGPAWADYDNDGDLDLAIAQFSGGVKLFRNDGGATFTDVTTTPLRYANAATCIAWGDYDRDGNVDLYVSCYGYANRLFRNSGYGTFTDVAPGTPLADTSFGEGVAWGDYDNDGDLDLYLANSGGGGYANKMFRNDNGTFVDATTGPLGDTSDSRGVAWGDYDNDGDLDLYIANLGFPSKLLRNDGGGSFQDVTPYALQFGGAGVAWGDYDNDGDLDLVTARFGGTNALFRNDGSSWANATCGPVGGMTLWRGQYPSCAWADYDGDGDIDIFMTSRSREDFGRNMLLRNNVGSGNRWLQVRLVGVQSNRAAIGARVRVFAGGRTQLRELSGGSGWGSQDALGANFGLGAASIVDSLQIRWPSGTVQVLRNLAVNQRITVTEGQAMTVKGGATVDAGPLFALDAISPNPFCQDARIRYRVPDGTPALLTIFDPSGRRLRSMLDPAGYGGGWRVIAWDGRDDRGYDLPPGVYFCRLDAGSRHEARRVTRLR